PVPAEPPAPVATAAPRASPPAAAPLHGEARPEPEPWPDRLAQPPLPGGVAGRAAPGEGPAPPPAAAPGDPPPPVLAPERGGAARAFPYAAGAGLLRPRGPLAPARLFRLLRRATPAPPRVTALLDDLAPARRPRLLCSARARVPFSHGLLRPTIVLPAALAE